MEYETGKWYGWNGGECPVHPETVVECFCEEDQQMYKGLNAGEVDWSTGGAFRIIKEHKEPREWWALWSPYGKLIGNFTKETAEEKNDDHYQGRGEIVHVREVIE